MIAPTNWTNCSQASIEGAVRKGLSCTLRKSQGMKPEKVFGSARASIATKELHLGRRAAAQASDLAPFDAKGVVAIGHFERSRPPQCLQRAIPCTREPPGKILEPNSTSEIVHNRPCWEDVLLGRSPRQRCSLPAAYHTIFRQKSSKVNSVLVCAILLDIRNNPW